MENVCISFVFLLYFFYISLRKKDWSALIVHAKNVSKSCPPSLSLGNLDCTTVVMQLFIPNGLVSQCMFNIFIRCLLKQISNLDK